MTDNYIIDTISEEKQRLYLNNAVNAIESLRNKISELNEMTVKDKSIPTMTEPHQVTFYIKDILNIPQRMNQEPNKVGMSGESYYITFIPVNKQDVVIELRITDHQRGEGYSDSYDNALHPNMRATTIVTKDDAEVPTIQTMPPHKCNGCKIKRICQTVPTKVYGTHEQVIQHLKTLVCLFQNGYFGKYKKKKLKENNTKLQYKLKQRIRLTEGDLHRIIRNCVNEALYVLGTSSM